MARTTNIVFNSVFYQDILNGEIRMSDLSVNIAGLEFKNPVMTAAIAPVASWAHWAPEKDGPEMQMRLWRRLYESDVGAVVTGTIIWTDLNEEEARSGGRFWASRTKGFGSREGLVSCATIPDALWSRTNGLEVIRRAKKEFLDMKIIASIIVDVIDPQKWGALARDCQDAGADMVELNCGSAMFMDSNELAQKGIELKDELPAGVTVGLVPEVVSALVKGIRKTTDIPIVLKQTPEMSFFDLMKAVPMYMEAGISAATLGHCFMTVVPPDIYNKGRTTFPGMETTTWWTTNGPWHRFACYRNVALVGKYFPGLDTFACGGLVTPEQCIEIMMLGAKGVQISAGIWWNGVSFPGKVVEFMKKYIKEQGYKGIKDVIGMGQDYIVEMDACQKELKEQIGKVIARVNYDKCVGTTKCKICQDNWCVATYYEGDVPKVNPTLCSSCNLCVIRCPHGARSLQRLE